MYNSCGISFEADLIDLAVENKIIERSGSWFSYGVTKLGQGRDRVRVFLEEEPGDFRRDCQKIIELKSVTVGGSTTEPLRRAC